ncbi:homoserine dehydrogenase [Hymenobacter sp. BT175]|uniref:homoserine dehydrogenase n=1 Tax=Hymenobacter translucens TaxID=2886507 RepID=UPI001D0E8C01|nr:homoserine dehydrogenase [Hymenobacter translucens]MCC2548917.1 homoserine dehydrogenase [Hymenobacter translucens]
MSATTRINVAGPGLSSPLRVGLIGFGCVGQGLYDILQHLPETGVEVTRIAVKNPTKLRSVPAGRFEFNADALVADSGLDVLVEVIDDPTEAFRLVTAALTRGRRVVTANKAMVACHLPELIALQREHGGILLYEAAVCGSIPVIRTLESYFSAEPLHAVSGIFNGSSNYVLTRMTEESSSYAEALAEAQALGFAETDPALDMAAFDPRSKAVILAAHALGLLVCPDDVLNLGIENITAADVQYARQHGYKIKVVAGLQRLNGGRAAVLVTPQLVAPDSPLYGVEREGNGVVIDVAFAGRQFLQGKGAGGHPTGSAVLADLIALRQGYRYAYSRLGPLLTSAPAEEIELEVYLRGIPAKLLAKLELLEGPENAEGYVIGFARASRLLKHRDELRKAGAFVIRTGQVRPVSLPDAARTTRELTNQLA